MRETERKTVERMEGILQPCKRERFFKTRVLSYLYARAYIHVLQKISIYFYKALGTYSEYNPTAAYILRASVSNKPVLLFYSVYAYITRVDSVCIYTCVGAILKNGANVDCNNV